MNTELFTAIEKFSNLATNHLDALFSKMGCGHSKSKSRILSSITFCDESVYFKATETLDSSKEQTWVSSMSLNDFMDCIADSIDMEKEEALKSFNQMNSVISQLYQKESIVLKDINKVYGVDIQDHEILNASIGNKTIHFVCLTGNGSHVGYDLDINFLDEILLRSPHNPE